MGSRYSPKNIVGFIRARYAVRGSSQSFSQYGEDVLINYILKKIGVEKALYVDIGTHHPVFGNNTYFFYRKGGRGVLVEPNKQLCKVISRKRPADICLNAGVGGADAEADFFSFPQSTRSTFSQIQADEWEKTSGQKATVTKSRVVSLDTIVGDYCHGRTPDLVSIDAEGLDEAILNGFTWIVRPKVFCIESSGAINQLMEKNGYVLKAQIFQNAVFVDKNIKNI